MRQNGHGIQIYHLFSWVVANHVNTGRTALNFHGKIIQRRKKRKKKKIYRTVYAAMPLLQFIFYAHEEAI